MLSAAESEYQQVVEDGTDLRLATTKYQRVLDARDDASRLCRQQKAPTGEASAWSEGRSRWH